MNDTTTESRTMQMIADLSLTLNDLQRKVAALDSHLNALGNFVTQSGQMMADKFQKIEEHTGLKLQPKLEEVKTDAADKEG